MDWSDAVRFESVSSGAHTARENKNRSREALSLATQTRTTEKGGVKRPINCAVLDRFQHRQHPVDSVKHKGRIHTPVKIGNSTATVCGIRLSNDRRCAQCMRADNRATTNH